MIIFDEAHHMFTDKRLEAIRGYNTDKVVLLSATLSVEQILIADNTFGKFKLSDISLQEVIENEILPTPKIKLIPLELNNIIYNEEFIQEWGNAKKRVTITCFYNDRWKYMKNKKTYPDVTLIIKCTQRQKYNLLNEQFEYYKKLYFQRRQEFIKTKWLQLGSQRKRFLGDIKTNYVKKLLEEVKNKRFICFCSSIEQAKLLGGDNAIHSERRDSLSIIQQFNSFKINNLFAVGMLQEGQNLESIEVGIIIQLDGTERPFIQKLGRVLRAKDPVQYIFYFKNTRDEEYLDKVLEGISINMIEDYELHN
jgi:superfamily II DNA or RNA helicase